MPGRQTGRQTDRQADRQTGTHMFIGCSSHTHESDMEPSKSYYGNKYTHAHEQQNKSGAKSRIHTPKLVVLLRNGWCFIIEIGVL